jgi:hypothetical protein
VKLVHLVGFIIKKFVTMHGRSHERKKIVCATIYSLESLTQTTSKIRVQQFRNFDVCSGVPSQVSCENIPIDMRVLREPMPTLSVLARPSCTSSHGVSCERLFFTVEVLTKNRSRLTENRVADFLCFYRFFREDSN